MKQFKSKASFNNIIAKEAKLSPSIKRTCLSLDKQDMYEYCYLGSIINLMAVLSSPSIRISVKAGMQIKSTPLGATNPLQLLLP